MLNKVNLLVMVAMFWMALAASAQQLPRDVKGSPLNASRVFGDLNEDGEVNLSDINLLIDVILTGQATPVDQYEPNMTIAEFKAKHWRDAINYADTVTEHEVIHGWVTSSDESGNIYKMLYITDESGAGLAISINNSHLYRQYAIGQEIVLPMRGYWIGKYNGCQMVGQPQWYAAQNTWEVSFLPNEIWEQMVILRGEPDASAVEPVDVSIGDFVGKHDRQTQLKYQCLLVRLQDVSFVEADGTTTYAEASRTTNRTLVDAEGHQLIVRSSNYADFKSEPLPGGKLTVVGELGYYHSASSHDGVWQLYLRDLDDVNVAITEN